MTLKKSGDGTQRDITLPFDSNTIPAFQQLYISICQWSLACRSLNHRCTEETGFVDRLFVIMGILFLSLTTVIKRLTTVMYVLFWMGELCPSFVTGLWFAELKFQCLDF